MTTSNVSLIKNPVANLFVGMGTVVMTALTSLRFLVTTPLHWGRTLAQAEALGADSAPMAVLICLMAGGVVSLQVALRFIQTGADDYVGGLVGLAIVREIAPLFTALSVGARSGTAMASEIANMAITEQLDALRSLHVHPVRYALVPRLVAAVITLPLLTMLAGSTAALGAMGVAKGVAQLHPRKFLDSMWLIVTPEDCIKALLKAVLFGALIVWVCGTVGLNTRGGTKEVGLSARQAAIWATLTIIVADVLLSLVLYSPIRE